MQQISEIIKIADQLDTIGLHKEADALDAFLIKRSSLLFKDKPFMRELAVILLAVRKYSADQIISEDLTLPISKTPIAGMTKNEVFEEVMDHLDLYIEKYMIPYFRSLESKERREHYRIFIEKTMSVLGTIKNELVSKHRSIRKEIDQLLRNTDYAVERLFTYGKASVKDEQEMLELRRTIGQADAFMGSIKSELAAKNAKGVEEATKGLIRLFKVNLQENSILYKAIVKSTSELLSGKEKEAIEADITREMAEGDEEIQEVYKDMGAAKEDLKRMQEKDRNLRIQEKEQAELQRYFNNLEKQIRENEATAKANRPSELSSGAAEVAKREIEINRPSMHDFRQRRPGQITRTLNILTEDVNAMRGWFTFYQRLDLASKGTPFSVFLKKKPKELEAILATFRYDLETLEEAIRVEREKTDHQMFYMRENVVGYDESVQDLRNSKSKDLWYEKYINKMVQALESYVAPRNAEQDYAMSKTLIGLRDLLEYQP